MARTVELDDVLRIIEEQPLYHDTKNGMRQNWVKAEIARKVNELCFGPTLPGDEGEPEITVLNEEWEYPWYRDHLTFSHWNNACSKAVGPHYNTWGCTRPENHVGSCEFHDGLTLVHGEAIHVL